MSATKISVGTGGKGNDIAVELEWVGNTIENVLA